MGRCGIASPLDQVGDGWWVWAELVQSGGLPVLGIEGDSVFHAEGQFPCLRGALVMEEKEQVMGVRFDLRF